MRKSDVTLHSDGYRPSVPAVNVKVYDWNYAVHAADVALDTGNPGFTWEWVEHNMTDEQVDRWRDAATEDAWELLQQDVTEYVWPDRRNLTVYSMGRMGGWAWVDGLPDIETWDAIDLARWARFAKVARSLADDIPRTTVWLIAANAYERAMERDAEQIAELATVAV